MSGGGASVPFLRPLLASVFAGSATAIGGLAVFFLQRSPPPSAVAAALSFAAGVMIVVSVFDLYLPAAARDAVSATAWLCAGAGASMALARSHLPLPGFDSLVFRLAHAGVARARREEDEGGLAGGGGGGDDVVVLRLGSGGGGDGIGEGLFASASDSLPASATATASSDGASSFDSSTTPPGAAAAAFKASPSPAASSLRLGALMCAVLSLHNIPEGAAVMVAGGRSSELGLVVAAAIFSHNIAEGVCVAVPVLAGTGDRWLALALTAASGASEPLGALLGYALLRGAAAAGGERALELALGAALCAVAGIMLYIATAELLPEARRAARGELRVVVQAAAAGAAVIFLCARLGE